MEGNTSTIPLRIRPKAEAGHTPFTDNPDVGPLTDKGKPSAVANDDWLVALLSSLWQSRDRSAQMRDIVESNVDPEEAKIAHNLLLSMPSELRSLLEKHTTLYLEILEDSLGQYLPGWLDEYRTGPLLSKSTTSVGFYVQGFVLGETPTPIVRPPYKPHVDASKRRYELQKFLEDDQYAEQHRNITKAISLYD